MEQQSYAEAGCKPKKTGKDYAMQAGFIAVAVILVIGVFLFPITEQTAAIMSIIRIVVVVAIMAGFYFLMPSFNYEYEYIFCDGQLDFDKISGGAKRKTVLRVEMEQIDAVAAEDSYRANVAPGTKVMDFSSHEAEKKRYVILCRMGEEKRKIIFEPTQKMLQCMKNKSPMKVEL